MMEEKIKVKKSVTNARILIDETVPKPKHRWIEGHEVGHSVIPWHREFLFGDNEFTLDPVCHAGQRSASAC